MQLCSHCFMQSAAPLFVTVSVRAHVCVASEHTSVFLVAHIIDTHTHSPARHFLALWTDGAAGGTKGVSVHFHGESFLNPFISTVSAPDCN